MLPAAGLENKAIIQTHDKVLTVLLYAHATIF